MIYIMSDIHGEYDAFLRMLKYINFSETDTLYILGDVIDKEEKSIEMLEYCISHPNVILLKGNHEDMMRVAINNPTPYNTELWYSNGGIYTEREIISEEKKKEYSAYIKTLPLYLDVEINSQRYLLVHAGVVAPFIHSYSGNVQSFDNIKEKHIYQYSKDREYFIWNRDELKTIHTRQVYFPQHKIIHGHTPIRTKCQWDRGVLNIDTGAGRRNVLSCYIPAKDIIVPYNIKADEFNEPYSPSEKT